MYCTTAADITDAQIQSQIDVLNQISMLQIQFHYTLLNSLELQM
jgi:hypothetical protein